jgi:MFS family permease
MLCGSTQSVPVLLLTLAAWGFFKGLYDANIFASVFDVVKPEARGTAAGFMNMVGWLGGGGTAPLVIGYVSERSSLSFAISITAVVYVVAGVLLGCAVAFTARRDVQRLERELAGSR